MPSPKMLREDGRHSGLNVNHFTTAISRMRGFLDVLGCGLLLGMLGCLIGSFGDRNGRDLLRLYSLAESDKCLLNVVGRACCINRHVGSPFLEPRPVNFNSWRRF